MDRLQMAATVLVWGVDLEVYGSNYCTAGDWNDDFVKFSSAARPHRRIVLSPKNDYGR